MDTYRKVKIFDDDQIDTLKNVYRRLPSAKYFQYYNLFNVEYTSAIHPKLDPIYDALNAYVNEYSENKLERHSSYFLNYTPGSFTRLHPDHQSKLTIVTLLESKNLFGGDTIISLPYERQPRPSNEQCRRSGKEMDKPPYGQNIIQKMVPVEDGESLVYGNKLIHGVTQVDQGSRVVFVNWYR